MEYLKDHNNRITCKRPPFYVVKGDEVIEWDQDKSHDELVYKDSEVSFQKYIYVTDTVTEQTKAYCQNDTDDDKWKICGDLEIPSGYTEQIEEDYRVWKEQKRLIPLYSKMSFDLRKTILPDYKILNANQEIYDATTIANYKQTIVDFRTEYYRIEGLIDEATTLANLDAIVPNFPTTISTA